MTRALFKIQAIALAVGLPAMDLWLSTLRCDASPVIDWSRFAFAIVLQLVCVAVPVIALHANPDERINYRFALVALLVAVISFPMVRQSLLLSDTATDKFFPSTGYLCSGVQRWRPPLVHKAPPSACPDKATSNNISCKPKPLRGPA